jgi:uncharacterized protein YfdQ (DUF2303 family)
MTDFQNAFDAGRQAKIEVIEIEDVLHVLVPQGCALKSMEELLPAPTRIRATPAFHDVEGFSSYVAEFKAEGTRIFVDDAKLRFFTVFDHHSKDAPAWGDHSASMDVHESPEWIRFKAFNDKPLSPKEFAEMIEDNLEYISAEGMTSADLLMMAQSFKVDFKSSELVVEDTLQKGLRNLVIKDDGALRGAGKEGKELEFPEKLALALRVFKNQAAYSISVWLRYRATKDKVIFFIKIPDPDGIKEKAFSEVIEAVKSATGLPTVKGSYSGPKHK